MMSEELLEEHPEDIEVKDKRRFNTDGERVRVQIEDAENAEPVKSAEVIKLENELAELRTRCEAAESKLGEVQKRFEEAKTGLEKETAEMRERLKKSLEDRAKESQTGFLMSLLPVLDNLNLAIDAAEKSGTADGLIDGVKGTARTFELALAAVGVERVSAVGETFDPERHEAMDMVAVEMENDGKVTAEYSHGYRFGERLLRPAKVQVGKAG